MLPIQLIFFPKNISLFSSWPIFQIALTLVFVRRSWVYLPQRSCSPISYLRWWEPVFRFCLFLQISSFLIAIKPPSVHWPFYFPIMGICFMPPTVDGYRSWVCQSPAFDGRSRLSLSGSWGRRSLALFGVRPGPPPLPYGVVAGFSSRSSSPALPVHPRHPSGLPPAMIDGLQRIQASVFAHRESFATLSHAWPDSGKPSSSFGFCCEVLSNCPLVWVS